MRQSADGVEVEVGDADGRVSVLNARYVVGADGGRSTVRRQLGLPFEGNAGTFRGIVFDAELPTPWPNGYFSADNEMGWVRAYAFGKGITRFNIVHRDRRHAAKDEPITLEEVLQCIRDVHGTDYGIRGYQWASRFDDQIRMVPTLRSGRVFLVGESARIHYPASGVGMNFCLQDAFNLGWKLAYVAKGFSRESILDSYDAERRPVMQELLDSVRAQCTVQFNFSAEAVVLKRWMQEELIPLPDVQRRLVRELCGLTRPYPSAPGSHPLTGQRAPDADLVTPDGHCVRLGELLRDRNFLLLDLEGYNRQFAGLKLDDQPVRVLQAGLSQAPQALQGITGLLVRPDGYVAWAGTGREGGSEAMGELARWLRGIER